MISSNCSGVIRITPMTNTMNSARTIDTAPNGNGNVKTNEYVAIIAGVWLLVLPSFVPCHLSVRPYNVFVTFLIALQILLSVLFFRSSRRARMGRIQPDAYWPERVASVQEERFMYRQSTCLSWATVNRKNHRFRR